MAKVSGTNTSSAGSMNSPRVRRESTKSRGRARTHGGSVQADDGDLQGQGQLGPRQGRGPSPDPRLLLREAARAVAEGSARCGRRRDLAQAPRAAAAGAADAGRQAGEPGPP